MPFAAGKTDEFHLCFICHMMVHCRFGNPTAWLRYVAAIEAGVRFSALKGRNFPVFRNRFLNSYMGLAPHTVGEAPAARPLRRIDPSLPAQIAHWSDAANFTEAIGHQGDLLSD